MGTTTTARTRPTWVMPPTASAGPTTHVGHEAAALAHLRALATRGGARPLLRLMTRALGVPLRSVTPQLRRLVFARDGGRCIVPGCKHWRFIDVHHVVPRAHRGPHRLENLACLCTAHHRAVHEGVLAIEGSATAGWVVRHAGAGAYGRAWVVDDPAGRSDSRGRLGQAQPSLWRHSLSSKRDVSLRAALIDEAIQEAGAP
jgi:hypothetical protein